MRNCSLDYRPKTWKHKTKQKALEYSCLFINSTHKVFSLLRTEKQQIVLICLAAISFVSWQYGINQYRFILRTWCLNQKLTTGSGRPYNDSYALEENYNNYMRIRIKSCKKCIYFQHVNCMMGGTLHIKKLVLCQKCKWCRLLILHEVVRGLCVDWGGVIG